MVLENAFDPGAFRASGHQLVDLLADYLERIGKDDTPVIAWHPPAQAFERWQEAFQPGAGQGAVGPLLETVLAESIHLHHPRYMGHQVSPAAPMATLASLLCDWLNNGMGVYEMGIVGTTMERILIKSVSGVMGFGDTADGFFTSGGTLANFTALLAARSSKAPGKIWEEGAKGPLALMVSEEAHYCVDRAARIMGWGSAGVIKIPVNDQFQMRTELLPEYFEQAKTQGITVVAVVGSACSTSTGAFDDLEAIAAFCQANNLWFHADGAHGAALAFSQKYKNRVRGLALADSVAMDFHKMLHVPAVTTALIFKEGREAYHTFNQRAQYLWAEAEAEEWHNLAKRTFECTKLMMGLKVFTTLQAHGYGFFDETVTRVCDLGLAMAALVNAHPHFELACNPPCNIVCFRYRREGQSKAATNVLNQKIRQALLEEGSFYIVQTQLHGETWLRTTITNPFTSIEDIQNLLNKLEGFANSIELN